LEKGGQGGFEAFLNPPKSPFSKGGLAAASLRSMPIGCIGSDAQMETLSKHYLEKQVMLYQPTTPKSIITSKNSIF
jgi:hypothetical protein